MPVTFVRKSKLEDDAVLEAAAGMEKKLAAAFIRAVDAIKGTVNMTKLTQALAEHDSNMAMAVLSLDKEFADALTGKGVIAGVQSFRDALQATYSAGASAAVNQLPSRVSVNLSFNLMSPEAINHLATYDFGLIQQVSQDSIETIRGVLSRAFTQGGGPAAQAREIRDAIGLTSSQEQAVANFRDALENGNLRAAMDRALRDKRYDPTLFKNLRNGTKLDQAQVDKMAQRYRERYLNYRATNIARSESIRASAVGRSEVFAQAQAQGLLPSNQQRVWIASMDSDTCSECADLDGETAGLGEEFGNSGETDPPIHPSCLLGDSLCLEHDIVGAVKRGFEGEIILLETASGNRLSCTQNHPILTERGWAAAHLLHVGDHVVSSRVKVWRERLTPVSVDLEHQKMPARIEDVVDAFGKTREVISAPVPTSAEDFHGDGIGSQVAVVYSNRFLRNSSKPFLSKDLFKLDFERALVAGPGLDSQRMFRFDARRHLHSAHCYVGCVSQRGTSGRPDLAHAEEHRFTPVSRLNSAFPETVHYRPAACLENLGKRLHRLATLKQLDDLIGRNRDAFFSKILMADFRSYSGIPKNAVDLSVSDAKFTRDDSAGLSGTVFLDRVVSVERQRFSGHVYNLQTKTGYYVANGIITHNCRCTVALV